MGGGNHRRPQRHENLPRQNASRAIHMLRKFSVMITSGAAKTFESRGGDFFATPTPNRLPSQDERKRIAGFLAHGVSKRTVCEEFARGGEIYADSPCGNRLPRTNRHNNFNRATCEGRLLRLRHTRHQRGHTTHVCPGRRRRA